jgi:hypothetical protein
MYGPDFRGSLSSPPQIRDSRRRRTPPFGIGASGAINRSVHVSGYTNGLVEPIASMFALGNIGVEASINAIASRADAAPSTSIDPMVRSSMFQAGGLMPGI